MKASGPVRLVGVEQAKAFPSEEVHQVLPVASVERIARNSALVEVRVPVMIDPFVCRHAQDHDLNKHSYTFQSFKTAEVAPYLKRVSNRLISDLFSPVCKNYVRHCVNSSYDGSKKHT